MLGMGAELVGAEPLEPVLEPQAARASGRTSRAAAMPARRVVVVVIGCLLGGWWCFLVLGSCGAGAGRRPPLAWCSVPSGRWMGRSPDFFAHPLRDGDDDLVPAGRTGGEGRAAVRGLRRRRCGRWPGRAACAGRARRPTPGPTGATCRRSARRRAAPSRQGPSSTCTSTPSIPRCWAHATPPIATRPAGTVASGRGTSIRAIVRTGASVAQPRSVQYAVLVGVHRSLDRRDPLRGGHEAVEARARPAARGSRAPRAAARRSCATATSASRPSSAADDGVLAVHPSTDRGEQLVGRRVDAGARRAGRRGARRASARCRRTARRPRSTRR